MSAAYLLSRYVLGIRPGSPGFADCLIAPECCDLSWAKGAWPSPRGLIRVSWRIDDGKRFLLEGELPEGMKAMVVVPSIYKDNAEIRINGEARTGD